MTSCMRFCARRRRESYDADDFIGCLLQHPVLIVLAAQYLFQNRVNQAFRSDVEIEPNVYTSHRCPREKISDLLQKYAGVTVEELGWEGCLYVEEYDSFYNFTSDHRPGFFLCADGQIMDDTVLLWSEPDETGGRCELGLRKGGDGWLIQSHHTIYER